MRRIKQTTQIGEVVRLQQTTLTGVRNESSKEKDLRLITMIADFDRISKEEDGARQRQELIDAGLSKIPMRYRNYTLDSYEAETEQERRNFFVIKSYISEFDHISETGKNLMLGGTFGNGKTMLCWIIFKMLTLKLYRCEMKKAEALISDIRSCYAKGSLRKADDVEKKYTDCDLLIIDELGKQDGGDSSRKILTRILDARYENMKSTITVTNEPKDKLKSTSCLGGAGYSRAANQRDGGLILMFTGRDRRVTA